MPMTLRMGALIVLFGGAMAMAAAPASKKSPRLTISEARAHLDKLEKESR